jgi:ketosteroid isomerase-like protein
MIIKRPFLITLLLCFTAPVLLAQADEQQIREAREASNQALKAYQHERVLSFLTEDALTTTGNGTLITGRESLRKYIRDAGPNKMYWVRSPDQIEVNKERGLAWENGTWKGYDPQQGDQPIIGGKYAAMWTRASGKWLIRSQLFVTLE